MKQQKQKATTEEIQEARTRHQTDDVLIDDDAPVSYDDEEHFGHWVSGWVWVGLE